jgi:hypothetical protein
MSPSRFCLSLALFAAVSTIGVNADAPTSVSVGTSVPVPNNIGDTWELAWTHDNKIFTPSDDSTGFGNAQNTSVHFNQVTGDTPATLNGVSINPMLDYGAGGASGPDGHTWKSSGCIALDGTLYWVVARHKYDKLQTAQDSSIIKSTDEGKTWTRSEKENREHPMFPGRRFATPYFISYGQEGHEAVADASDRYVYAMSNDGFWDNGNNMVLGRVLRSKIGDLNGKDWQFFKSGDGTDEANWSAATGDAQPVIDNHNHLGMGGPVYLATQKCYFMAGWYYPAGGGRVTHDAPATTNWDFYTAPHPWGPWKIIGSHTFHPEGFYSPGVCPKFTSADGNTIWAYTAGDFQDGTGFYKLFGVPLTLK